LFWDLNWRASEKSYIAFFGKRTETISVVYTTKNKMVTGQAVDDSSIIKEKKENTNVQSCFVVV
jgi:hypothetical protein